MHTTQRYHFSSVINRGSTATVFLGSNNETGKDYAFKVVERTSRTTPALRNELRTQLRLRHPNVAQIHDVLQLPSHTVLVLDHYKGGDLLDRMPPESGYLEAEALTYFNQLVDALDYLHSNEVVHRDIKLENLCLDEAGQQLHLIDFGFACFTADQENTTCFAGSTPGLAPELVSAFLAGERPSHIDWKAVDIWGAGCVLYQMLTGDYLWDMASPTCTEYQHYSAGLSIPWEDLQLSQLSTALLASTLRTDPTQRPTAANLKKVLQAAFASIGVNLARCASSTEVRKCRSATHQELNVPTLLSTRGRAVSESDLCMNPHVDSMDGYDTVSFFPTTTRTPMAGSLLSSHMATDLSSLARDDMLWGSPRAVSVGSAQ